MYHSESFEEQFLDSVLDNPSASGQLGHLRASYSSDDLIDLGIRGGAIEAFGLGRMNRKFGSSEYNPGVHRGTDIKTVNTADGNEQIIARNPKRRAVPPRSHVVVDIPERTSLLTGNYAYGNVANYLIALTRHVSDISGNTVAMYVNNGVSAGLIFEGNSEDAYIGELNMELGGGYLEESDTSLSGLLNIAEERSDANSDGLFIISDLQDAFDPETEKFDWEEKLEQLCTPFNDRVWITRVTSPSHTSLPYGFIDGVDVTTIDAINNSYLEQAKAKDRVIADILGSLGDVRKQNINLFRDKNIDHPINLMTEFVLGQAFNQA